MPSIGRQKWVENDAWFGRKHAGSNRVFFLALAGSICVQTAVPAYQVCKRTLAMTTLLDARLPQHVETDPPAVDQGILNPGKIFVVSKPRGFVDRSATFRDDESALVWKGLKLNPVEFAGTAAACDGQTKYHDLVLLVPLQYLDFWACDSRQ